MKPISILTLITAGIPIITAAVKKILHTETWDEKSRKGIHCLTPILLGILSAGLYEKSRGSDWMTALAVGLGSGGAASSARDIDKNILQIVSSLHSAFQSQNEDHPDA